MILESVFMIRGGSFGQDFGAKAIMSVIGLLMCVYDWRENDKRKDYFWVFVVGAVIWSTTELILQVVGTRVLQTKYFFGLDVTNIPWLTIPLQGMSEGAFVAVIGVFFGDRLRSKETRKKWALVFGAVLAFLLVLALPRGIHFDDVNAGDLSIPSRRDMFPFPANLFILIMCALAFLWWVTTDSYSRNRGFWMYGIMAWFIAWWTFTEWLTGQRWIETGIIYPDGSYANLTRAPLWIEFLALGYDYLVEVSLIYVPFLAIPYWLKLIKPNNNGNQEIIQD